MTTKEAQSEAPSVDTIFKDTNYNAVLSKSDGLVHIWVKNSDREVGRISPELLKLFYPKAKINRLIKLAKKEERNRLTHQQIDSKIISSDDFKIEFELKFTDEPEHKYVFASSPKGFQVAVDGKNIVSKLSNNLSKGDGE